MPRLIWTPQALADVSRLYRFLLPKDAEAARRAAKAIRAEVRILADRARIGRAVDDMGPEFREWSIRFGGSGYLALYRIEGDSVSILAVRHQKEAGYHD